MLASKHRPASLCISGNGKDACRRDIYFSIHTDPAYCSKYEHDFSTDGRCVELPKLPKFAVLSTNPLQCPIFSFIMLTSRDEMETPSVTPQKGTSRLYPYFVASPMLKQGFGSSLGHAVPIF